MRCDGWKEGGKRITQEIREGRNIGFRKFGHCYDFFPIDDFCMNSFTEEINCAESGERWHLFFLDPIYFFSGL